MMNEFISSLVNYNFLSRALITSIIVGIVCCIVGSLIILRCLSLMGDAMSHAVLPGVALSYLFNIPMIVGALFTGMLTSFLIGFISQNNKTKNEKGNNKTKSEEELKIELDAKYSKYIKYVAIAIVV